MCVRVCASHCPPQPHVSCMLTLVCLRVLQIVEPLRDNSGRGPFSRMLSRQRVPLPWADRNTLLGKVPTKAPVTPPRAPPGGRKLQSRTPPRGDGVFASMVPCDASSGSRVASAPQRLAAGSDTARARAEAAVAAVEAAGGGGGVTHKPGCCHAKRSPDGGAPDRPPSSSSGGSTGRRSVRDAMPLHAAGQRPRSARAARPSTGFVDRFERRPGVSPITGLPLYVFAPAPPCPTICQLTRRCVCACVLQVPTGPRRAAPDCPRTWLPVWLHRGCCQGGRRQRPAPRWSCGAKRRRSGIGRWHWHWPALSPPGNAAPTY